MSTAKRLLSRWRALPLTRAICTLVGFAAIFPASHASAADKIDSALRAALTTKATSQSIILSLNPGCRAIIRRALEQHGDAVRAEHDLIDALSARVHSATSIRLPRARA
jgi:urease accessory protein UreF